MPEKAALIAVLITDRPLCLPCLSAKARLPIDEIQSYLGRIDSLVILKHAIERCQECGKSTEVYSMFPPA
jgi:hypothetical protein